MSSVEGCEMDSSSSGQGQVIRFYQRRNEPSDFIRGGESCLVCEELSTY